MAKVTLITTVKNEEKTIENFLESVAKQTKKPTEVVIVDGGSNDSTVQKLKVISKKLKLQIRIIKKRGNRSVGRNTAIKASIYPIIAVTDAGCILNHNWLEKITKPFERQEVDVVAGFYRPITYGVFEKCLATYTCVMPDKLKKKNFLPSSRSVSFRKLAWERVGGYPENLDTCEDLVFDKRLKQAGMKFITVPQAIVYWPQRKNILAAAAQFFSYAHGDGKARYFRWSTPFLFGRYTLGAALLLFIIKTKTYELLSLVLLLLVVYLVWSIQKNYKYVKNWKAFFYLPLLQFVSDICVLLGTTIGFIRS